MIHRDCRIHVIIVAASVLLAPALSAQETVRVTWPLIDFVVRGDTAGIIQLLASPNLGSVQGTKKGNAIGSIDPEPGVMLDWAASVRRVVDSISDVDPTSAGPVGPPLFSADARGSLTIVSDPRGRGGKHFIASFDDSISDQRWRARASRNDLDTLLGAMVEVASWVTHPTSRPELGSHPCPVPTARGRSNAVVTPPRRLSYANPAYPSALVRREGRVWAQFVVDASGAVDTASFCVLLSDHEYFAAAVRRALPSFRFAPARHAGIPTDAMVIEEFRFQVRRR